MRIEQGFNPNCSEAVFRFYTDDAALAQQILQAFADEVGQSNDRPAEIIPAIGNMKDVESVAFGACAGLGEPVTECHWEPDHKAFVLCIGNNDLSPDGQGCQTVRDLGIKVEEAETCPDLRQYARDCTCGIIWFEGNPKPVVEVPSEPVLKSLASEE